MVQVGREIVRLRATTRHPAWSRFAFLLVYPDHGLLVHSLTSTTIHCDDITVERILKARLTKKDCQFLKKEKLLVSAAAADNYLFARALTTVRERLEKYPPDTLFLIATDRCNLNCIYCFENLPQMSRSIMMTWLTMKAAVDRFLGDDPRGKKVFFYGGEPMLAWHNVKRCVEYIRKQHGSAVDLQIITNGTVKGDELTSLAKTCRVGVGVSLDGPEEITNSTRIAKKMGMNVFAKAFRLISSCNAAGVDCAVLCTIAPQNGERVDEIADFFMREGFRSVIFNLQVKRAGIDSTGFTPGYWDALGERMAAVHLKLRDGGILDTRALRYISGIADSTFTISECDAGYSNQIVVHPSGKIGPCQGFLHDHRFWIDPGHPDPRSHPIWRQFRESTTLDNTPCRSCAFLGTCGGGCHYNRHAMHEPSPNFCQYIRSFLYHVLKCL